MGGIVLILGTVLGYFVGHLVGGDASPQRPARAVHDGRPRLRRVPRRLHSRCATSAASASAAGRRSSARSSSAAIFAVLALIVHERARARRPRSTIISGVRDIPWLDFVFFGSHHRRRAVPDLGRPDHASSTSNGVNVADGLDGLATGASILAIGVVHLHRLLAEQPALHERPSRRVQTRPACYHVPNPLDLAVVAACISRRPHRVPLVEHLARADLPRRHRLARPRRGARRPRDPQPHRAPARADRRPVPGRHRLGDPAARSTSSSRRASASS